ncbi:MAG: acyltransferase [Muribaculaceae bacterium]
MKISGQDFKVKQIVCLALYYGVAQYLPVSYSRCLGGGSRWLRFQLCKRIFKKCGENINVERLANFGSGHNIEIGDNSGLGIRCCIPSNTIIGANVMMGPNCYILPYNHSYAQIDRPMNQQGFSNIENEQTVISDDIWIGRNVTMTPGRHIAQGSIIGACCLLCKDFPEYAVVGGNPSRLIKYRK